LEERTARLAAAIGTAEVLLRAAYAKSAALKLNLLKIMII
jgi:hypothetical protein